MSKYNKAYYEANKERLLRQQAEYYQRKKARVKVVVSSVPAGERYAIIEEVQQ